MKVRVHKNYWGLDIKKISNKYNSTYLGDFCIKQSKGWTEVPVSVFYNPNPDISKGHSNYFGLYIENQSGMIIICNAESAFSEPFNAIKIGSERYAVSCYRHDYWESKNRKYMIDGGRDYLRTNQGNKIIKIKMTNGIWQRAD